MNEAAADVVDEVVEDDEEGATLLTGVAAFSTGRPLRSKKSSASLATSAEDMLSTSFPIISRMREGIVFSRCSFKMWSSSTSLTSSLS